jgi:hypothetical protein
MSAHPLFSHFVAAAVRRRDEIAADASRSSEDAADTHPTVN